MAEKVLAIRGEHVEISYKNDSNIYENIKDLLQEELKFSMVSDCIPHSLFSIVDNHHNREHDRELFGDSLIR